MRRLFKYESVSVALDERSTVDLVYPSWAGAASDVVDLLPNPFNNALNFRFVAFIAQKNIVYRRGC